MDSTVKAILERAKATASYAAERASRMADYATKKAGDMANITKLNLQIFDLNTDIDGLYKEIGKGVYHAHAGADVVPNELEDKIVQIDEKYAKIAEIRAELAANKTTVPCSSCGNECSKDDVFCSRCGERLR